MLLKHHGHQCEVLCGRGDVRLVWYESFADLVAKTQKNFFGIMCRFSLLRSIVAFVALLWLGLFPLTLLAPVSNPALWLLPALGLGRRLLPALFAPIGLVVLAFVVLRAGVIGARLGGITWRGGLYRSDTLRDAQRFRI